MKRLICVVLLCSSACSEKKEMQVAPPVGLAGSKKLEAAKIYQGTVDEVIQKDQFSYVRMGDNWFALVGGSFKRGQPLTIEEQAVFADFESKTLKRSFKKIVFGIAR